MGRKHSVADVLYGRKAIKIIGFTPFLAENWKIPTENRQEILYLFGRHVRIARQEVQNPSVPKAQNDGPGGHAMAGATGVLVQLDSPSRDGQYDIP